MVEVGIQPELLLKKYWLLLKGLNMVKYSETCDLKVL